MTSFREFAELILYTIKDKDYRLIFRDCSADATIVAVHGGGIEPLTSELATAIAGQEHNLYDFRGLRAQGNDMLRIPIHRFDDMRLQNLMKRSQTAIAIQGAADATEIVHLGGRNKRLREIVREHLQQAGFETAGPTGCRPAHDPALFFNWPAQGGIQIELPTCLRAQMATSPLEGFRWEDASCWNTRFHAFVEAVRSALAVYQAEQKGDLGVALEHFENTTRLIPRSLRSHRGNGHEH